MESDINDIQANNVSPTALNQTQTLVSEAQITSPQNASDSAVSVTVTPDPTSPEEAPQAEEKQEQPSEDETQEQPSEDETQEQLSEGDASESETAPVPTAAAQTDSDFNLQSELERQVKLNEQLIQLLLSANQKSV